MKDRIRIMLGNQEIVKRYIGDRLVWSGGGEILLTIEPSGSAGYKATISFSLENTVITPNNFDYKQIKSMQADDKPPLSLPEISYLYNEGNYFEIAFVGDDSIGEKIEKYTKKAKIIKFLR